MGEPTENDALGAAIAVMEAQIAKLQSAIETLQNVRGVVGGAGASASSVAARGDVPFGHDAFFNMTVADASKKYLSGIKTTATAREIAEALIAGGWKTTSKHAPENIRTILNRHPLFVIINGKIGLAEWYPGRKNPGRSRAQPQASDNDEEVPKGMTARNPIEDVL